jgi:hypothetical protein
MQVRTRQTLPGAMPKAGGVRTTAPSPGLEKWCCTFWVVPTPFLPTQVLPAPREHPCRFGANPSPASARCSGSLVPFSHACQVPRLHPPSIHFPVTTPLFRSIATTNLQTTTATTTTTTATITTTTATPPLFWPVLGLIPPPIKVAGVYFCLSFSSLRFFRPPLRLSHGFSAPLVTLLPPGLPAPSNTARQRVGETQLQIETIPHFAKKDLEEWLSITTLPSPKQRLNPAPGRFAVCLPPPSSRRARRQSHASPHSRSR